MQTKVYKVYHKVNGQRPTIDCVCDSLEEARSELNDRLKWIAEEYGHYYFKNADALEFEIEQAKDAIRAGDWTEEEFGTYINALETALKDGRTPCVIEHYGEIHSMEWDSISYDNWSEYIKECDVPIEWNDIDELDEDVATAIQEHLESMSDDTNIEVKEYANVDEALFIKFTFDDEDGRAIYYESDDILLTPDDWQGFQPDKLSEIENCQWIDSAGDRAIVINGLPRLLMPILIDRRKAIGERIRELREQAGMTQPQLAEKACITQTNLSRIESARYGVTLDTLTKISIALGVDLNQMM